MTRAQTTATTQQNTGGALPGFVAGKNRIINGDFFINQRGFTSTTGSGNYGFDRWLYGYSGGTVTSSPQNFTAGTAPVSGYEGKTFFRQDVTGQSAAGNYAQLQQPIEDVRTFAGQTVTVSFWAKSASATPKIAVELQQNFGTGGSPSSTVSTPMGAVTISTSWTRYSVTVAVPSISGKTIGTDVNSSSLKLVLWTSAGSSFATGASSIGIQTNTFDIWGVQIEAGSAATPFQTATGTIQGELAACQRYYFRFVAGDAYSLLAPGQANSATQANAFVKHPVTMRTKVSSMDYSTLAFLTAAGAVTASGTLFINYGGPDLTAIASTGTSSLAAGNATGLVTNNSTSAYLGFSAEL